MRNMDMEGEKVFSFLPSREGWLSFHSLLVELRLKYGLFFFEKNFFLPIFFSNFFSFIIFF